MIGMPTDNSQEKSKTGRGDLAPAKGRLGIMIPGMGAVATTFVAGVEAVRKGIASPIGSMTQMGTIRLGKRTEGRSPKVKDFVPLAGLSDADQGRFPVPRLDPGGADCPRLGAVPGLDEALGGAEGHRHSGVAELLF